MGVTNEFERDLVNQAQLKHPGRVDMIAFQNIPDAGDGSPGVQRCFRNYLHEGGMEKDLELIGFGIKGTSVNINNAELQQLSNIGASVITASIWTEISHIEAVTITNTQWGYVGALNQGLTQTSNVNFGQITPGGNIIMTDNNITFTTGLVDGVNISTFKSDYDTHKTSSGIDHSFINQDVKTTFSPTFVGLTLSADLVTDSTVDGVDVSAFKTEFEAVNAIGSSNAQTIGCIFEHDDYNGHANASKFMFNQSRLENVVALGNSMLKFAVPLPCNKGPYSLKLDDVICWLYDLLNPSEKVDAFYIYGIQNDSTEDILFTDENNITTPQTKTWDIGNVDCSGYWKIVLEIHLTTAIDGRVKLYPPILKYFYS